MKSIVLFGDSLLSRMGRDYIHQLENNVDDLIVCNCAIGGLNTRDAIKRMNFIAKIKPDFVCLSFGVNDGYPFHTEKIPIDEFVNNLISIIKVFNESKIILFPCPPGYDANDLVETKKFNDVMQEYNSKIKEVAHQTGTHYIDSDLLYGKLQELDQNYHIEDGLHLNDLGYEILVAELSKIIKN